MAELNFSDFSNLTQYQKFPPPALKSFWFEILCLWLDSKIDKLTDAQETTFQSSI